MLTRIPNYTVTDVQDGIRYLLDKASQSEEVRQLAIDITSSSQDPIASIYGFVKQKVTYTPDEERGFGDIELFISPVRMVKDYRAGISIAGDCDDMALLTVALCRSIGIESNVVLLDTGGKGVDHAIAEVYSEKLETWITLDPSAPEVPLGWIEHHVERIKV